MGAYAYRDTAHSTGSRLTEFVQATSRPALEVHRHMPGAQSEESCLDHYLYWRNLWGQVVILKT